MAQHRHPESTLRWQSFEALRERYGTPQTLLDNLREMGYQEPTAIQRQATAALMEGHELLAIAPTGEFPPLSLFNNILWITHSYSM